MNTPTVNESPRSRGLVRSNPFNRPATSTCPENTSVVAESPRSRGLVRSNPFNRPATSTCPENTSVVAESPRSRELVRSNHLNSPTTRTDTSAVNNSFLSRELITPGYFSSPEASSSNRAPSRLSLRSSRVESLRVTASKYGDEFHDLTTSNTSDDSFEDYISSNDQRINLETLEVWREQFIRDFVKPPYTLKEDKVRRRIRYFPSPNGMTQDEIKETRRPYERVYYRASPRKE